MRRVEKIIALVYSILLFISGSSLETFIEYPGFFRGKMPVERTGQYYSVGNPCDESPFFPVERFSDKTKDRSVSQIRKNYCDVSLTGIRLNIREDSNNVQSLSLSEAILLPLTTQKKIYPSHFFL